MISTASPQFGRLMTAMVTPFKDDLKVDTDAVERIVEHLIATGTQTILVSGTTGESPTLSPQEKKELLKLVISTASGRAKIMMGTGSNSTEHSMENSMQAEKAGADAVLVVAPYYNKPSQNGLRAHFGAVAKAISIPMFIYNIPGRTGINVSSQTTVELAATYSNVRGLKDSTNSTEQAAEIAGSAPGEFRIYSGDDYLTLPLLSVGASGVISVASHIAGSAICEMIESFFDGKLDRARQLHYQYLPLFRGLFSAPNPTCVKFALSCLGICKPHLRLPLVPLTAAQAEDMRKLLSKYELQTTSASSEPDAGSSLKTSAKTRVKAV